jgi:hypothetical protein
MRKLSNEEMLFGMIEGKEYTLSTERKNQFKGKFSGYQVAAHGKNLGGIRANGDHDFGYSWDIYDFKNNCINECFTVHGWYFTTED